MDQNQETTGRTGRPVSREQERLFRESGPFYHLYTSPLEEGLLYQDDGERNLAVLYLAVAAHEASVGVLAYVLMSNHFHMILKGTEARCLAFFAGFRHRLEVYYSRHGRPGLLKKVRSGVTRIDSVRQFRDEIAYVLRNPFVVRSDINPLTYFWGSGSAYFNPWLESLRPVPVTSMSRDAFRSYSRSGGMPVPPGLMVVEGRILPSSFVQYRLVERLFESTRQFLFWVFKNVEAQVEAALRYGEKPHLSDEELLPVCLRICRDLSGQSRVKELTSEQTVQLCKQLKYGYDASNGQIARLTGIDKDTVNAFFPLSVPPV